MGILCQRCREHLKHILNYILKPYKWTCKQRKSIFKARNEKSKK